MTAARAARLLVVDDEPQARAVLSELLRSSGYAVAAVADAAQARVLLGVEHFCLAVCDLSLPGESGLSLMHHIAARHPGTGILVVSGRADEFAAEESSRLGAFGYLVKPFGRDQLAIAVANALRLRELAAAQRVHEHMLEEAVRERTAELRRSREETVRRLALAVEFRDWETRRHSDRTGDYAFAIAREVGLDRESAQLLRIAAPLHDVGKIAIPDRVLHKPGPLSPTERALIQTHAEAGYRMLRGSGEDLLDLAAEIAWTHHERLDGSGYPRRLRGPEIPRVGRIVAVADVADALLSDRPYRDAYPTERAVEILAGMRGRQLEGEMVDALLSTGLLLSSRSDWGAAA